MSIDDLYAHQSTPHRDNPVFMGLIDDRPATINYTGVPTSRGDHRDDYALDRLLDDGCPHVD